MKSFLKDDGRLVIQLATHEIAALIPPIAVEVSRYTNMVPPDRPATVERLLEARARLMAALKDRPSGVELDLEQWAMVFAVAQVEERRWQGLRLIPIDIPEHQALTRVLEALAFTLRMARPVSARSGS